MTPNIWATRFSARCVMLQDARPDSEPLAEMDAPARGNCTPLAHPQPKTLVRSYMARAGELHAVRARETLAWKLGNGFRL
ncbi:hypothetical protein PSPO01_09431 [Paraphaeosphaeria sporulosa]